MEEPKEKSKLQQFLSKGNNAITILVAIVGGLSAILVFYIGMVKNIREYSDETKLRQTAQEKNKQFQDNQQQAYILRQIWVKDLDSIITRFSNENAKIVEQSIKKDSVLMLIFPKVLKRLSLNGAQIDKVNHKLDIVLDKQVNSEKIDVIKILNYRDSIAFEKARNDSLDRILLREIHNMNQSLLDKTKYGDRAR